MKTSPYDDPPTCAKCVNNKIDQEMEWDSYFKEWRCPKCDSNQQEEDDD